MVKNPPAMRAFFFFLIGIDFIRNVVGWDRRGLQGHLFQPPSGQQTSPGCLKEITLWPSAQACMAPGDGSGEGDLQDKRPAHSHVLLVLAPRWMCGHASVSWCVEAGDTSSEKRRTSLALAAKLDTTIPRIS